MCHGQKYHDRIRQGIPIEFSHGLSRLLSWLSACTQPKSFASIKRGDMILLIGKSIQMGRWGKFLLSRNGPHALPPQRVEAASDDQTAAGEGPGVGDMIEHQPTDNDGPQWQPIVERL